MNDDFREHTCGECVRNECSFIVGFAALVYQHRRGMEGPIIGVIPACEKFLSKEMIVPYNAPPANQERPTTDLGASDDAPPYDDSAPPIHETIAAIGAEIPREEWEGAMKGPLYEAAMDRHEEKIEGKTRKTCAVILKRMAATISAISECTPDPDACDNNARACRIGADAIMQEGPSAQDADASIAHRRSFEREVTLIDFLCSIRNTGHKQAWGKNAYEAARDIIEKQDAEIAQLRAACEAALKWGAFPLSIETRKQLKDALKGETE